MWNFVAGDKNVPYEPSMHVPLLARGPGFSAGTTTNAPVCGQDITATCLAAATATPSAAIDGVDLRSASPSRVLFHERSNTVNVVPGMPSGAGVTTSSRKLWRHQAAASDQFEMYLLDTDPDELTNVAYDPAFLDERNGLESQLDAFLVH
jgi:choline-sulfatase